MSGKQQDRGVSKNTNKEAQEGGLGRRIIRPRGWSGQDGFGLTARWMLHFFRYCFPLRCLLYFLSPSSFSVPILPSGLCVGASTFLSLFSIFVHHKQQALELNAPSHTPLSQAGGTMVRYQLGWRRSIFFIFGILWILQFCCPPSVSAQAL